MQVRLAIRVQVVLAMVRRPPQRALLTGRLREKGHGELPEAIELVGAMAEIAVVPAGDGEHPQVVRTEEPGEQAPVEGHGQHQQNRGVHCQEREHCGEVVVLTLDDRFSH